MLRRPKDARRASGLLRDQRGTASLEAAMVLPLMALCWLGLFYRLGTLDATLQAGVEARRAAWVTSNNACQDGDTAYECVGEGDDIDTGFLDGLTHVPIVGWLFGSLLGSSTIARVTHEVNRPRAFGGGTTEVGYGYYIMCNEQPISVDGLLRATICEQLGGDLGFIMQCPADRHPEPPPEGCAL